jgi:hypothetical protein
MPDEDENSGSYYRGRAARRAAGHRDLHRESGLAGP